MTDILYPPLITAFLLTSLLIPFTIKLAKRFKLMDDPSTHKHPAIVHSKPVPRAGGLPIYCAIVTATLIYIPLGNVFVSILTAGAVVVITGLLDDKYDVSPYLRFIINIFASSYVVFQGITVPFITNPFGGILHIPTQNFSIGGTSFLISLPAVLGVIWIVWVMNMLNWSKGVDGQMPGIAAVASIVIGIASLRFAPLESANIHVAIFSFIVAGASLGFLLFNYHPARIFPGYSATILGFAIGILSILSSVKLATAILVMGIPTADALFTVIRRIVSKKSPFRHDRGHLHHYLLSIGWGHRKIALFYWFFSILLGLVALNLTSKGKLFAIILVLVVVGGFIMTLRIITKKQKNNDTTE